MAVMRYLKFLVMTAGVVLGSLGWGVAIHAVQLADGTVYFERPPSLLNASATTNRARSPNAKYYFDLDIPSNAGEPLQQVTITQQGGGSFVSRVRFEADETQAFLGTRRRRGEEVSIASSTWDEESQTVTVIFAPPVAPGNNITIRLEPEHNPRRAGVYLFGVTAYPAGEISHGQFLGYGRFQFITNQNIGRFFLH